MLQTTANSFSFGWTANLDNESEVPFEIHFFKCRWAQANPLCLGTTSREVLASGVSPLLLSPASCVYMVQNPIVIELCVQRAIHILPTGTLRAGTSRLGVQLAHLSTRSMQFLERYGLHDHYVIFVMK